MKKKIDLVWIYFYYFICLMKNVFVSAVYLKVVLDFCNMVLRIVLQIFDFM